MTSAETFQTIAVNKASWPSGPGWCYVLLVNCKGHPTEKSQETHSHEWGLCVHIYLFVVFFFMIMVMIRSVIIEAGGSSCLSNSTQIFLHSCITGESERATKQISAKKNKQKKTLTHQMLWPLGCSTGKECSGSLQCKNSTLLIVLQYMDDNIVVVIFVWYQVAMCKIHIDFNLWKVVGVVPWHQIVQMCIAGSVYWGLNVPIH